MAREIELKLAVSAGAHNALVGWLGVNVQAAGSVELADIYYDTCDQALACNRAALRVRRQGSQWLQTLKTAAVSTSGLSARHEWEVSPQNDALSVDAFIASNTAEATDYARPHTAAFTSLFRTDFMRRLWYAGAEGGEIEIALNAGTIPTPGTQVREPIDELELEWKPVGDSMLGKDAIAECLHAWTQTLRAAVPGLMPLDISKAQRGYQLREEAVGGQTWRDAPIRHKPPSSMNPWWTRLM